MPGRFRLRLKSGKLFKQYAENMRESARSFSRRTDLSHATSNSWIETDVLLDTKRIDLDLVISYLVDGLRLDRSQIEEMKIGDLFEFVDIADAEDAAE